MSLDDKESMLDDDQVGLELSEILSSTLDEIEHEEIVTKSELEKQKQKKEEEIEKNRLERAGAAVVENVSGEEDHTAHSIAENIDVDIYEKTDAPKEIKPAVFDKNNKEKSASDQEDNAISYGVSKAPDAHNREYGDFDSILVSNISKKEDKKRKRAARIKKKKFYKSVKEAGSSTLNVARRTQQIIRMEKYEKAKSRIGKVLLFIVGLMMASLVYATITLINIESNRGELQKIVRDATDRELRIDGDIDYVPFPPQFIFKDIKFRNARTGISTNMLEVEEVRLTPSLFKLIFGSVSIVRMEFIRPKIYLEYFNEEEPNWNFDIEQSRRRVFKIEDIFSQYVDVNSLILSNAQITLLTGNKISPTERSVSLQSSNVSAGSYYGPFDISGVLGSEKSKADISYEFLLTKITDKEPSNLLFSLQGSSFDVSYAADVVYNNDRLNVQGDVVGRVNNSGEDKPSNLFNNGDESLSSRVAYAFLSGEYGNIKGDLSLTDNILKSNNLEVTSDKLNATLSLDAEISNITQAKVNLDVKNVDLDRDKGIEEYYEDEEKTTAITFSKFLNRMPSDTVFDINAKVDNLKYDGDIYSNIGVDGIFNRDKITIRMMKFKSVSGDMDIILNGALQTDKNTNEKLFMGSVKTKGKLGKNLLGWVNLREDILNKSTQDIFNFSSEFSIAGDDIFLNNYSISGDGFDVTGNLSISRKDKSLSLSKENKMIVNLDIKAKEFDASRLFDTHFERDDSVIRKGIKNYAFFDWIRRLGVVYDKFNVDLDIKRLMFNDQEIKDLTGQLNYVDTKFSFSGLNFILGNGAVDFDMEIDNSKLTPIVDTRLRIDELDVDVYKKILDIKDTVEEAEAAKNPAYFSNHTFNLTLFSIFNGMMDFKINKIISPRYTVENIWGKFKVADNRLSFERIRGNIFDGTLKLEGYMDIESRPDLNVTVSAKNMDLRKFADKFFGNGKNMVGRFSSTGTIRMNGFNMREWVSSLEGKMQFALRGTVFKGANFKLLSERIGTLNTAKEAKYWTKIGLSKGYVGVDYISGQLKFINGSALFSNAYVTDKAFSKATITGRIDLPTWEMDLKSDMWIRALVKDIPLTMEIKGNILDPEVEWSEETVIDYWKDIFFSRTG